MKNLGTWLHNYNNLNPEQQLEVAKAIVNTLEEQRYQYTQDEQEKSKSISFFLKKVLESAAQQKAIGENGSLLKRFDSLSNDNKSAALSRILAVINDYIALQDKEDKDNICQQVGHLFCNWHKRTWTAKEVVWDAGPQGYVEVEYAEWYRTCERCGLFEVVDHEPQELVNQRNEKNRKARIRQLESELKNLKGE